ncbi:transmembrane reductase CYB561D2-like [Diachasmimorpha longicaudata]|uniref:transmembrane reductase CYB561D2-like n=1 Tax=Diachasmimorpha longicaudata TaxID=58733 RepID=UPI0030B8B05D
MKPETEGKGFPNTLNLIVSVLVHLLLLAPVLYIISIFSINYQFFSWHPICMSVGVGFLILEGVFSISGEANLSHRLSRANRVTTHWIMNTVGLTLMFIGLIIIVVNKNRHDKPHFQTTHGQLGLSSIVIASVVAFFGILTNNTRWLYPRVRPIFMKVAHGFGGMAMTILFVATIINGVYKMPHLLGDTGNALICAALVIAVVVILFKPMIAAVARTKVILQPPHPRNQST